MSDLVTLDRRSMCDECTCDRSAHKPIWHVCKPIWRHRDVCDEHADQRTEHGNEPMYQIEHFKHIPIILHMKIKSWII